MRNVNISTGNVASRPTSNTDANFTLLITSSNGLVSGTFTHTNGAKHSYQGVITQKGTLRGAYGYFLTNKPAVIDYTGESGGVSLIAKP